MVSGASGKFGVTYKIASRSKIFGKFGESKVKPEKLKEFEEIEKEYLLAETPPPFFQERVEFCGLNFKVSEILFLRKFARIMSSDFREFKQFFMLSHPKTRIMLTYFELFDPEGNQGFNLSDEWKFRLNLLKNLSKSMEDNLKYRGDQSPQKAAPLKNYFDNGEVSPSVTPDPSDNPEEKD